MDDKVEPKTEPLPSVDETDNGLVPPLSSDETTTSDTDEPVVATANSEQPSSADNRDELRSNNETKNGSLAVQSDVAASIGESNIVCFHIPILCLLNILILIGYLLYKKYVFC